MKQKKTLVLLLVIFAALLAGAYFLYQHLGSKTDAQQFSETESAVQQEDLAGQETKPQKVSAPDFLVYDEAGNEVRLSDFLGTPVVVNFWASWCGPCRGEMPEFQTAYETYGDSVQFLMVNMTDGSRETVETASAFITDSGYTFPVLYDTELSAARAYGVRSLPATYFIDAEGFAVAYGVGAMNLEVLESGLSMILPS